MSDVITVRGTVDIPGSFAVPLNFSKSFAVIQALDIDIASGGGSAVVPFGLIDDEASFVLVRTNQTITVSPASGSGEDFVLQAGGFVLLANAAAWDEMTITNNASSVASVQILLGD